MRALLVDPSLFTAPYDGALSKGLRENGVSPLWATRGLRPGEEREIPASETVEIFYSLTDGKNRKGHQGAWQAVKGFEHVLNSVSFVRLVERYNPEVIHYQWAPLPLVDVRTMQWLQRKRPVVLTVHDTTPFNGTGVSVVQSSGFRRLFTAADHLIVHTEGARERLIELGVSAPTISVVAHGPLAIRESSRKLDKAVGRWRIVLFGRLQHYKGIDVLIEAVGALPKDAQQKLEIIIAGESMMDLAPIEQRATDLGLSSPTLTICSGRLSDQEVANLLSSADAFVFPYRAIEASGVYFLTESLNKWTVASSLGAFEERLSGNYDRGELVPPGDIAALANALMRSVGKVPMAIASPSNSWFEIGAATRDIYKRLIKAQAT